MSMKNSNDAIGNRTCDLPACSAEPQPSAPPRAPFYIVRVEVQEFTARLILSLKKKKVFISLYRIIKRYMSTSILMA